MKQVALYVRVSTEAQAEEGYSIDAQKERLSAYCLAMDWKSYEFYVDGGFSGSHLDRPAMNLLVEDVKQGKLSTVVVYKLDRLSRSQKDTLYLIEDVFLPHQVDFLSLGESIDTSTPYGRAMIGILSAFAQLERENIYLRTRMGMLERVKQGYWMGGGNIPYGYRYDKEQGILVPHPQEALVVEQIYQLYIQGLSPQKIADKLGLGYDRLVTQIIDRRSNLGLISYKGQEYRGRHQPLVSPELFRQAQAKRAQRASSARAGGTHLLSGLLFCGACGSRMRYLRWGKGGYKLRCYSQDKSKSYMSQGIACNSPAVWAEQVEQLVAEDFHHISLDFSQQDPAPSLQGILQQEIAQQEQRLKRLYRLYGQSQEETLASVISQEQGKLRQLKEHLQGEEESQTKAQSLEALREKVRNLGQHWENFTLEEKQGILRDCISRIEIQGEELSIHYVFLLAQSKEA